MSDYVTLLGSEEVQSAARVMAAAADQMQRAASDFDHSVARLERALQEHAAEMHRALDAQGGDDEG